MAKAKLINLKNCYLNRTAAILGGGPSLPEDLQRVPPQSLLIAVNDHAFHLGVRPDLLVFMDDPHIKPELWRIVQEFDGMRVTELQEYTDLDMRGVLRPDARSGIFAAWLALYLGCAPVLLCGMDLYTGDKKYCHDRDDFMGEKAIYAEPLDAHLKQWRTLRKYNGHQNLQAISGPLVKIFGKYVL